MRYAIIKTPVIIEEYYKKEKKNVYRMWRFAGMPWNKELTPFKEIPYIYFKAKKYFNACQKTKNTPLS